ncbi:MAG: PEGA domain-containing protein [Pseudomonadales bacterium]|nr:PEGA domain-containing protein [Pseudomonadales bacterium]
MSEFQRSSSPATIEAVEAIRFTPTDHGKRGPGLSLWHYVLALAIALALFIFWFIFTTRSVTFQFSPTAQTISVSGGLSFEVGNVILLREGTYRISAITELHEPFEQDVFVGADSNQTFEFAFVPLPGFLRLNLDPSDAQAWVDGEEVGLLTELPAGEHELSVTHPRYQPYTDIVEIEGKQIEREISVDLRPNWSDVAITSSPPDASIYIDGELWPSLTPTNIEALAGEREIEIRKEGYKSHRQRIFAQALQPMALETAKLIQADAQLTVTTRPSDVGVLVNGQFIGQTPIQLDLKSATTHTLQLIKAGYATVTRSLSLNRNDREALKIDLRRQTGQVTITVLPDNAEVWIDGAKKEAANETITLPIRPHDIELKLAGHAGYRQTITPKVGLTQEIKVKLLTLEEARLAAMKPAIQAPDGQTLLLFQPEDFKMGASRREPGRRANETLRDVAMTNLFYLATHETTNKQFRAFASGHDSGKYVETSLNDDEQPAVALSWHDAASYCNWLSEQERLAPFYNIEFGKVRSVNPQAIGYRLPTEAEWSWAARTFDSSTAQESQEQLRFPWGKNLPPPERHGNYADRAASSLVGRVIFGYNDNYAAAAPIGTYKANHRGLYDIGGNAAEWVSDFYEIPGVETVTDPTGPTKGEYHVIKGSSWMHGSISELRYSFRDYGIDGRQDVGFRIARYVETPK